MTLLLLQSGKIDFADKEARLNALIWAGSWGARRSATRWR